MITFAYDETNGFESVNKDNFAATMLAGIIYNDNNEKKYSDHNHLIEPERVRIIAYLQAVCDSCSGCFPNDLHVSKSKKNNSKVKLVKEELRNSLPEFFNKGTYKGKELIFITSDGYLVCEKKENSEAIKRAGSYQLVILFKSASGKTIQNDNTVGFQNSDYASNLYQDMVQDIIKKSIFINPYLNDDPLDVTFNLPTRVIPRPKHSNDKTNTKYDQLESEYARLGYEHVHYKIDDVNQADYWEIINAGNVQQIIKDAGNIRNINIEGLTTTSINYNTSNNAKQKQFAFLYLSDCVCSYLDFGLKDLLLKDILKPEIINNLDIKAKSKLPRLNPGETYDKSDLWYLQEDDISEICTALKKDVNEEYAKRIRSRMNKLNYSPANMFFYYADVDMYFEKAMIAVSSGRLFDAMSYIYDGKKLFKGYAKRYYSKKWFKICDEKLKEKLDQNAAAKVINEARNYRETDNIDQRKLLYYFEYLCESPVINNLKKDQLFKLYDLGISAYTHIGNTKKAEECFSKCMELKESAEESEIIAAKNRMITLYNDKLQFEEAVKYAVSVIPVDQSKLSHEKKNLLFNISGLKTFAEFFNSLIKQSSKKNKDLDQLTPPMLRKTSFRAWGSLGQAYAFAGMEEAENCFIKILDVLNGNDDSNYVIDLSYLLHYYIDTDNKAKYEEWALNYYGNNHSLGDQLEYIIKMSTLENNGYSLGYSLFVFIKAFYYFYKDNPNNQELLIKLTALEHTVREILGDNSWDASKLKGHPFELIYKYAALLSLESGNDILVRKNRMNIRNSVRDSHELIVKRVMDYGDIEFKLKKSVKNSDDKRLTQEFERSVDKLWNTLSEGNYLTETEKEKDTCKERFELLKKKFTYMYH